jgi:hypothetical protein
MDNTSIINELRSLQVYFLDGYERSTRLIEKLESVYSPAPSGVSNQAKAQIINMVGNRSSKIMKKAK